MQEGPNQYSAAYKRVVVLLLMTAYTFNAMDRSIISIVGQSIKLDLELTDTELGLLSGTAFAVLYAVLGGGFPLRGWPSASAVVNIITVALHRLVCVGARCAALH